MSSAGFEPLIPAIKWPQTYALDRAATRIGTILHLERQKFRRVPSVHGSGTHYSRGTENFHSPTSSRKRLIVVCRVRKIPRFEILGLVI